MITTTIKGLLAVAAQAGLQITGTKAAAAAHAATAAQNAGPGAPQPATPPAGPQAAGGGLAAGRGA